MSAIKKGPSGPIVFNKKELENKKQISKSVYGNVYRIGGNLAYKKFKSGHLDRSIMREVKYLSELDNEHIVRLVGVYLSDCGRLRGFLMPLYPIDLHDWINNNTNYVKKIMPRAFPDNLKNMIIQITHGVEYIHSSGIMHCDIKERNIMIDSSRSNDLMLGDNLRLVIIDFGLANEVPSSVAFTPNYKPIEVLLGETYDKSADIWSLGCVFLATLIGEAPFFPNPNRSSTSSPNRPSTSSKKTDSQIKLIDSVFALDLSEYIIDIGLPLRKIFDYNPTSRITAKELLLHFGEREKENKKNIKKPKKSNDTKLRSLLCDCIMHVVSQQRLGDYNMYDISIYCFYILDLFLSDVSDLQMRHISESVNEIAAAIVSLCLKFLYDIEPNPEIEEIEDIIFCELQFCMPTMVPLAEQSAKLICYLLFDAASWDHIDYNPEILKLSELPETQYSLIYTTASTNLEDLITETYTPFFYS